MLEKLNRSCTQLNFLGACGRHCTSVERQPTASASAALIWATATRMNGRFTDMLPVTPGSFTFSRAATQAMSRKETNCTGFSEPACKAAFTIRPQPETTTNAMKRREEIEVGILVLPILSGAQRSHAIHSPDD